MSSAYLFYCHDDVSDQSPFVLQVLVGHEEAIAFARLLMGRWPEYLRIDIHQHEEIVATVGRRCGETDLVLIPSWSAGPAGSFSLH